ncbi:triacylglycerol lipase [Microbacterium sp. cx-59]|uniref:esterase/lipase family protein n=1 Tax=Microbacterium sp. cx-59 TaxID=2891207 RepID=UPI001E2F13F0|nr:alpha/beta hydrolase [Microbacterium sp. cx-59]MCC4907976.1 alpha/beta hydrolase [Microbacterium sp. cx-59]
MHAVVLVSGGAAVTPFTTPDAGARTGLAAGNTMTAMRAHLLRAGHAVFTAPARIGPGTVADDTGWQGFSDVPAELPAAMTINAAGTIADAGHALHTFLAHLTATFDLDRIDVVAHSMGGLFTRAALGQSRADPSVAPLSRLVTLGTPWSGSLLGDVLAGDIRLEDAHEDPATIAILEQSREYADRVSQGAAGQVSHAFLAGADGWNDTQRGALDDISVTLIGGSFFASADQPPTLWPHDGLVALRSASAREVSDAVLPRRTIHEVDDVHSIYFADRFGLSWDRALTWDPRVFDLIDGALRA